MPSNPARIKFNLTEKRVEALESAPPGRRYIAWDASQPSFGVRVTDKGRKSFLVVRARGSSGQLVYHVLGAWPAMKVDDARKAAPDIIRMLARGEHPKEIEEQRQREETRRRADTVGSAAEEFIKRYVRRPKNPLRTADEYESMIRRRMLGQRIAGRDADGKLLWEVDRGQKDSWRERPISSITRRDVRQLLEAVVDEKDGGRAGNTRAAGKVYSVVRKFFDWVINRDDYGLEHSPCDHLDVADIVGKQATRERVLSDEELRFVWRAAGDPEMGVAHGALVKALMLAGQRLREISDASWPEIDATRALLTVPGQRMKHRKPHTVPLVPSAMVLLEQMPRYNAGRYIFTMTSGRVPLNGFTKMKKRIDRIVARLRAQEGLTDPMPHWTWHDLRRTVRTRLVELGELPEIVERVIGHLPPKLQRTYDLHQYNNEKRAALERWERALLTIVGEQAAPGAEVVPMRRR